MKSFIVSVLIGLLVGLPLLYLRSRKRRQPSPAWTAAIEVLRTTLAAIALRDWLLGFNLGFGCAALLLGPNLLTSVIASVLTVIYIALSVRFILQVKRRKASDPDNGIDRT